MPSVNAVAPKMPQMASAPMMAPAIWAAQYAGSSRQGNRLVTASAKVTAGLMWHPDTLPRL